MRDPFRPNTNHQLVREAQFGFTVIGLLIAVLIYVAYYRLNGLDNVTPPHIQDSPVAMQVFPSSPNYDSETHTMFDGGSPLRNTDRSAYSSVNNSPLVHAPKKILAESQNTFRALNKTAESIEDAAAEVKSLANVPISRESVGLVGNPATTNVDSGFNPRPIEKTIPKVDASTKLPESATAFKSKPALNNAMDSKPNNPVQALLNQFAPTKKKTLTPEPNSFVPPAQSPEPDLRTSESFSGFKPANRIASTKRETKTAPTEPTVEANSFVQPKRLAGFPERSLSDLRSPLETVPAKESTAASHSVFESSPKANSSSFAPVAATPNIATVSFEQTTWTVIKGDSFWSIAQSHYGDGRFFRALYEQNRQIVPGFENLTEGIELDLPSVDQLCQMHPTLCPSDAVRKDDLWRATPDNVMEKRTDACEADLEQRIYESKRGDTLFGIARQQLGQASRYVELLELNRFRIDSNLTHESKLPPGTQLLLPIK